MRTEEEVSDFRARAFQRIVTRCEACNGGDDLDCECRKKHDRIVAAFEACIPQDFWWIKESDVTNNLTVFNEVVKPYVDKLNKALRRGYGLLFLGDNGVGKTYFISYILMAAIRKGRSTYYTTMPDLDYNIKRGFKNAEIEERLHWMLTSDLLAVDEVGKERAKSSNAYMDAQVERLLKRRIDDSKSILLATNMDMDSLDKAYGPTVASMLAGKFQSLTMEPGDFRSMVRERMIEEMGYE